MTNLLTSRLYEERKIRLNLTQAQVAKKAKISLHEYRKYENGEKEMTIEFLQKIFYAGIDIQYVITGFLSNNTYDDELQRRKTLSELGEFCRSQRQAKMR